MSKTCQNCGNIFDDNTNVCPRCGMQYIESASTPQPVENPYNQAPQQPQTYQQPYQQSYQQNYQQPNYYNQQYQQQYNYSTNDQMTLGSWVGTILLTHLLGIISIILLFVWGFSDTTPPAKKTYCRAMLIYEAVMFGLVIVMAILMTGAGLALSDFLY